MAYEGFDPAKVKKRKWYEVDNPEARPYLTNEERRTWGAQKKRRENNQRYVSSRRNTESIENNNSLLLDKKEKKNKVYYNKNGVTTSSEEAKFTPKRPAKSGKDDDNIKKLTQALRNAFKK